MRGAHRRGLRGHEPAAARVADGAGDRRGTAPPCAAARCTATVRGTVRRAPLRAALDPGGEGRDDRRGSQRRPGRDPDRRRLRRRRPELRALVAERIEKLRPAGIRVVPSEAVRRRVDVRVELTLAGAGLPGAELTALKEQIEARLAGHPVGDSARRQRPPRAACRAGAGRRARRDANVVLSPEGARRNRRAHARSRARCSTWCGPSTFRRRI